MWDWGGLFLFEIVVVHFYGEDDSAHGGGAEVAEEERPIFAQQALDAEKHATDAHQQECAEGDVIGFAGFERLDGLRQIAEHHANGGCISHDIGE